MRRFAVVAVMAGLISFEAVVGAETDLVNAKMDAAGKPEERVTLLTEARGREAGFLESVEGKFKAGTITQADVHRAQSLLLATEIRLLRERGTQKAAAK
jgi:hypothetical protein